MPAQNILEIEKVDKFFHVGDQDIQVLKEISVTVEPGDFLIIFGASGSGKSTLLHVLLGLEAPTNGTVKFLGSEMYEHTTEDYRSELRKKNVGMVYQQANWIKALNVLENIAFPLQLLGMEKDQALDKALKLLEQIGLEEWAYYIPTELSSGQQQRVSLARALIHDPTLIVADEPTGNLDFESGQTIMELLTGLNRTQNKTVIMVTHDLDYLGYANKAVQFFDGEIIARFEGKEMANITKKLKGKKTNKIQMTPDKEKKKKIKEKEAEEQSGTQENKQSSKEASEKDSKGESKQSGKVASEKNNIHT